MVAKIAITGYGEVRTRISDKVCERLVFMNQTARKWVFGIFIVIIPVVLLSAFIYIGRDDIEGRLITDKFVRNHLLMQNGGIRTKFKDEEFQYDHPGGADVLSESQGLLMRYAISVRDEALFTEVLYFLENTLYTGEIISYRYSKSYGTFPANAAIDDFRIIRALLEAADAFKEPNYQKLALEYADQLYNTNVEEYVLYDFYEPRYAQHNAYMSLCYADFRTMHFLGEYDERWKHVLEYTRPIVKNGYISDAFPMFATSYDYMSGIYDTGHIQTLQSLMTAIHLAELGICPSSTIRYIKEKVILGELYGAYSGSGEALNDIQSTAVYAVASILGKIVGDEELQSEALIQMQQLQISEKDNPIYGAFGNAETQDVYAFDNLYALLAFMEAR